VNVEDQKGDPASQLNFLRKLIQTSKAHKALGEGEFNWAGCDNTAIAAYYRSYDDGGPQCDRILVVQNLSGEQQSTVISLPERVSPALVDLLAGAVFPVTGAQKLEITLEPYAYYWLQLE
jgi:maltose alpha-D-glucosyltransferase/alpha-amylase